MNIQNPKDTANLENMKNKLKEYYEKEKSRLEKSPWIPTEIDGLDFLLKGGLLLPFVSSGKNNNKKQQGKSVTNSKPKPNATTQNNKQDDKSFCYPKSGNGLIILIKGPAGSGKTALAAEILFGILQCKPKELLNVKRSCHLILGANDGVADDIEYINKVNYKYNMLQTYDKAHIFNCELNKEIYRQYINRYLTKKMKLEKKTEAITKGDIEGLEKKIIFDTLYENENEKGKEKEKGKENKKGKDNRNNTITRDDDAWLNDLILTITRYAETYDSWVNHTSSKEQNNDNNDQNNDNNDKPKRIILIDGLNSFPSQLRPSFDMQAIISTLRKAALISIIVYEDEKDHHENLDYLADMVIHMEHFQDEEINSFFFNRLCIEKSRFQDCTRGWHQYRITEDKIVVYPNISSRISSHDSIPDYSDYAKSSSIQNPFFKTSENSNNKTSENSNNKCDNSSSMHNPSCSVCRFNTGMQSLRNVIDNSFLEKFDNACPDNNHYSMLLDIFVEQKIKRGSTIAILGPKYSLKFILALDFLRSGSAQGEDGLMLMLDDKMPNLDIEKSTLCNLVCRSHPKDKICYNNIHNFKLKSKWITPADLMYQLDDILRHHAKKGNAITRFVLCDLIQLEERFPFLARDHQFIPTLLTFLRYDWGITSVIVGSAHSPNSRLLVNLAAHTIYTWHDVLISKPLKSYHAFYNPRPRELKNKKNQSNYNNFFFFPQTIDIQNKKTGHCEECHPWQYLKKQINDNVNNFKDFKYALSMREKIWSLDTPEDSDYHKI
ncbi:MAG: hypothetical protein ACE14O_03665 [Candidatus Cloacimonadaceae bacterium]